MKIIMLTTVTKIISKKNNENQVKIANYSPCL